MNEEITCTPSKSSRKRERPSPGDSKEAKKKTESTNMSTGSVKVGELSKEELMKDIAKLFEVMSQGLAKSSELEGIKTQLSELSSDRDTAKADINELKGELERTNKWIDDLCNRSRRNNVVVRGLSYDAAKDQMPCPEYMRHFFKEALNVDVLVNRAHPMGDPRSKLLIAHLPLDKDVDAVFRKAPALKGTNYFVYRDFSKRVRNIRGKLFYIRKNISQSDPRLRASVVYDHMYVGTQKFEWDEKNGLRSGKEKGTEVLKRLLPKVDWEAIEEQLKNERPARQEPPQQRQEVMSM